jgi:hypothetical protein
MGWASAATHIIRRWERTPRNNFKMLLEEVCPNHAYPVRHKLKDCGMMRSFLSTGSLTCGAEPDKGPEGSDSMPFPEENAIMTVLGGRLPSGSRHIPA